MSHPEPTDRIVRAAIALADRQRRLRGSVGRTWRLAPLVAAASLVVAATSRWAGWSPVVPLSVLAAGILGLAVQAYLGRRAHAMSDTVASGIDADAGLGGELRSASWFAARDTRDAWAELHLGRAANRLHATDWSKVYPTVRTRGVRLATAAMAIAALVSVLLPERAGLRSRALAQTPGAATGADALADAMVLSPELQKLLEALLAGAETGQLAPELEANPEALRDLLAQLERLSGDPKALEKLARAMAGDQKESKEMSLADMKALAERAKRASEMSELSPEVRSAMEQLSKKLSIEAKSDQAAKDQPSEAVGSTDSQQGDAAQSDDASSVDELSIQAVKDASAGGGGGMLMISGQEGASTDAPGTGMGGGAGKGNGAGKMAGIQQALRQETIEASTDDPGEMVLTDQRRKTEFSHAAVTYTRGAAGPLDRSRAAAPPAVPEGRRAGLRTYFIRKQ